MDLGPPWPNQVLRFFSLHGGRAPKSRLYAVFRLSPYGPPKIRALKKAQKLYFFDWNAIEDEGLRFENFVAVHLLKWIYHQQDTQGRNLDLRFFRDKADHEVDFIILESGKPIQFIECKLGDAPVTKGLRYLRARFPKVRSRQLSLNGEKEYVDENGIEVGNVTRLLSELV
jgi:predicted AAA+ superfamily ATPase